MEQNKTLRDIIQDSDQHKSSWQALNSGRIQGLPTTMLSNTLHKKTFQSQSMFAETGRVAESNMLTSSDRKIATQESSVANGIFLQQSQESLRRSSFT